MSAFTSCLRNPVRFLLGSGLVAVLLLGWAQSAHAQPTFSGLQPADGAVLATAQGTLTGTATGAVTLSINGEDVPLGGGGSGDTFSWSFDLPEGQTVVQLYAEDSGGQSAAQVHQLVVDTREPQVTVTQPSSSVVGSQPVQMSGTYFEPHLTSLTVAAGGTVSTAAASGGTWSASVPLVEGPQTLTVSAQDSLGHSASFPITLTLDTLDPSVSVTESGAAFVGGLFNRAVTPVISTSDATELTLEQVLDGATFVSGTTVSAEGSHSLDVIATDRAGNSTAVQIDFVVDTTPPSVGTISPASGTVLATSTATLQVEATGADLVRVTGPGGSVESSGSGLFTVGPVALVEGPGDLVIEVFDDAGNRTPRTHRLVRDTSPPVLTVTAPSDGDVVSAATVPAQGVAQDARLQSVTVNGLLANLVGEGWSVADVPLVDGSNVLTVVATDSVGHQTTRTVTVERDTAAPVFQVLVGGAELVSGATFSGPVSPVIQVDEVQFPGATVAATLDGAAFTSGTEVSTDGSHELSVTVTSSAGVSSTRLLLFTIDQVAPTISEVLPAEGHLQQEAALSLSGTVSGSTASGAQAVTVDGQPATLFQGSFSAGPFTLAEGTRTFTIVATGANGLETTRQHTVERDSTPPQVTISSPADGALVGDPAITVSGTAIDPNLLSVTVNETPATISASVWNALGVPLREGSTTLTARAEDRAGNVAEVTRTVVLDTEAPQIVITDPSPGTLVPDATYEIRGTVTDEHVDRVDVSVTAVSTGETSSVRATLDGSPSSNRSFFVSMPLADGTNQITATARDLLGATASDSASIERDASAPQVRIVVPDEGAFLNTSDLEVRGTVDNEEGITVRVSGLVAPVELGAWVVAAVPLSQGENRLLARATDAQGNEGIHTRTVYLDQQAPSFVRADPASGALALPVDAVFRLEFSEPLSEAQADAENEGWTLTAGGTALSATVVVDGNDLRITPVAPLPSQAQVVLTLTTALTDRAGNALANPPAPLVYDVVDVGAPDAVVLDFEPSRFLCSPEVVLTGTAEATARVEAQGGASSAWVRAADDGTFLLEVELLPERLNRLELRVTDTEGNASPATVVEVVHDCTGPEVVSSELVGQTLTIEFSEAVDESTVTAASVSLRDAAGSLAFTAWASGDTATLTLSSAPAGSVLLDVTADLSSGVRDLAANPLAYPYRRLFGDASGAESFVAGTVIDDATGRPLAGATVQITATDGAALGEPLPQQTTGGDGRFLIPVSAGTHDLTAARPGYTPVFRIVTSQAGEGTNVFDPRLTPLSEAATVSTSGGTVSAAVSADGAPESGESVAQLTLPSGALTQSSAISLTQLGEQALTALLPYGWSPRGAVYVESEEDFLAAGSLSLPVRSSSGPTPAGTTLELITLDFATLQWQVVGTATVTNGNVTVSVPSLGAYAAVEADTGANAPPAAVVGQVLGSSPSPGGGEVESALLTFDPEVVLPTQRARATATYTLAAGAEDAPSGLPLTLVIEEELELLDGSILRESPYRTDLIVYRDDLGTPSSEFWLKPSETARSAPIQLGGEDVTILPYGDETVRGNVLGPEGGAVVNDEGDRLDVPAGALTGPAAVVLERQTAADLPLGTPRGATVDVVVDLDLGGARFETPADLSFALDTPPPAGSKGLLLQVVEIETDQGPETTYRVLAELLPTAGGWETAPIDVADLAWPGVRVGGQLVAVRLTEPHGFARGEVVGSAGQLAGGAVVSSASVDWIQITDLQGRYVLPLPTGDHVVAARSPQSGNAVQVAVSINAGGERIDLDPTLQVVAPWIVEVTPADGSDGMPVGIEPTVRFSEPVDRTTLAGGLELLLDDVPLVVEFDHQGDFVRILPEATLVPGQFYELRIGSEIRDLDGYSLNGPLTTSFQTEADPSTSGQLDRTKVVTLAPDSQGLAQITGAAGAVPGNSLVYVENLTSYSTTESVAADQDGSFQLAIGAALNDRLLLHVLIDGSSEDLMTLGPFLSADQKAAYVQVDGAAWNTIENFGVEVQPGTFTRATWVRAELRTGGPIPTPAGFNRLTNLELDFGGARAYQSILLTLPAPGASPSNEYLLSRYVEALGFRFWMVMDLMWVEGATITNARAGEKAVTTKSQSVRPQSSTYGVPDRHRILKLDEAALLREEPGTVLFDAVVRTRALATENAETDRPRLASKSEGEDDEPPEDPFQAQVRLIQDGFYDVSFTQKEEISWLALQANAQHLAQVVGGYGAALTLPMALYDLLGVSWVVIPTLMNEEYELEIRDLTTGYQLYRDFRPAPTETLEVFPADDYADSVPPFPTRGNPIRIHSIVVHEDMEPLSLPRDTEVEFDGDTLTVTGERGAVDESKEGIEILLQEVVRNSEDEPNHERKNSAPNGSFELTISGVESGDHYLFVTGASLGGGDRLEISFSEALPDPPPGIELVFVNGDSESAVEETILQKDNGHKAEVFPTRGWRKGDYALKLGPTLQDVGGEAWKQELKIKIEVPESFVLEPIETERISDMARLGNLLLAATNSEGLRIYDMTHPSAPQHYLKQDRGIELPLSNLVRGVDVDAHGRIFMVGGGQSSFGQMKLIDLTKVDPDEITANDEDEASFYAEVSKGFRGSTLLSDPISSAIDTVLRAGMPRRVAVANNDLVDRWVIQEGTLPSGVTLNYLGENEGTLSFTEETLIQISGEGEEPNTPITLRNATRGLWSRDEADENGRWEIKMKVARYDHLVLQRSRGAFAYVAIDGVGLALVDILDFFDEEVSEEAGASGEEEDPEIARASNIVDYILPIDLSEDNDGGAVVCDTSRPSVSTLPTDIDLILDQEADVELSLFSLIQGFGFAIQTAQLERPQELEKVSVFCGAVEDQATLTAMDVVHAYGMDLNGDGEIQKEDKRNPKTNALVSQKEVRDYVILGHGDGYILIVDVTNRTSPLLKAQVKLSKKDGGDGIRVSALAFDRHSGRIFVSAFGEGILVVDFSSLPTGGGPRAMIDADGDGKDDRILETIKFNNEEIRDVFLLPDFGVALAGSDENLTGVLVGEPEVSFLAVDKGPLRKAYRVAPFGVPTGPEDKDGEEGSPTMPGIVRLQAVFPGLAEKKAEIQQHDLQELEVELLSVGPEMGEVIEAGDRDGIPPTSYTEADQIVLRRMSDSPWEDGHSIYLSDPLLVVADLTAASAYELSQDEKDECDRCDLQDEDVYPDGVPEELEKRLQEVLSGHFLLARPAGTVADHLQDFYEESAFGQIEGLAESVPWDIFPSLKQEPVLNSSRARGGLLGTVLHSGEQTWSTTDLVIPAIDFDLAFTRNYRSQTVGSGPLGPGWDHSYNIRLRELPNEDVELFDGAGRKLVFEWDDSGDYYESPPGLFVELIRSAVGFTLTDSTGMIYRFDSHGRLRAVSSAVRKNEKSGTELVFSYDERSRLLEVRVVLPEPDTGPSQDDPKDYYLGFAYNEDGFLKTIRDSIESDAGPSREYSYEYESGLLKSAETEAKLESAGAPETLMTRYSYLSNSPDALDKFLHAQDNLESITDAEGDEWIRFQYAAGDDGRYSELDEQTLTSSSDVGSLTSRWALNFVSRDPSAEVTVTDGLSNDWTYHHTKEGHLDRLKDPKSHETRWVYGAHSDKEHGLIKELKSPGKLIQTWEYQQLPSEGGEAGSTIGLDRLQSVEVRFEEFNPPGGSAGTGACESPQEGSNGSPPVLSTTYSDYHERVSVPKHINYPGGLAMKLELDPTTGLVESSELTGASEGSLLKIEFDRKKESGLDFLKTVKTLITGPPHSPEAKTRIDDLTFSPEKHNLKQVVQDQDGVKATVRIDKINDLNQPQETRLASGGAGTDVTYNSLGWPLKTCRTGGSEYCTSLKYDKNGRVVETKPPSIDGNLKLETTYGSLGEIIKVLQAGTSGDLEETREYDENLNLVRVDSSRLFPIEYEYDDRNLLTKRSVPSAPTLVEETFTYDADGRVKTMVDANGNTWRRDYDGFGRPMKDTDPKGNFTLTSYDSAGRASRIRSCNESGVLLAETKLSYDSRGLVTSRSVATEIVEGAAATFATETLSYDGAGSLSKYKSPSGAVQIWEYDALGRLEEVKFGDEPEGENRYRIEYEMDERGNVTTETHHLAQGEGGEAPSVVIHRLYDSLDRMTSQSNSEDGETTFDYDGAGNVERLTLPGGITINRSYDSFGRLKSETRPSGLRIDNEYDDQPDSRVVRLKDQESNTTEWTYDGLGRLTDVMFPDGSTETVTFDAGGNPESTTRRDGTVWTTFFDELGQPTSFQKSGGQTVETYEYDGLGRVKSSMNEGVSTAFEYNGQSLPTSTRLKVGETSAYEFVLDKTYSLSGLPEETIYPTEHRLKRSYNSDLLASVSVDPAEAANSLAEYTWWSPSILARVTRPDESGADTEWTLDGAARHKTYSVSGSDGPVYSETLVREPRGLVKSRQVSEKAGTSSFAWETDGANQLRSETRSYPTALLEAFLGNGESFDYNNAQAITEHSYQSACGPTSVSFSVAGGSGNQVSGAGGSSISWTANGNLEDDGQFKYSYDHRNRLVKVEHDSETVAEYGYDAQSRRVVRTVGDAKHATVWDGWQPIEERELIGGSWVWTHRLTHGAGLDEILMIEIQSGAEVEEYTPVYDTSGSIVMLLGSDGELKERYFYRTFGERWVWSRGELPRVEQVRFDTDQILIELSEEILPQDLAEASAGDKIRLEGLGIGVTAEVSLAEVEGRMAGRRIRIHLTAQDPADLPVPGTELSLVVEGEALKDSFNREPATDDVVVAVPWGVDAVLLDIAQPEVEEACLTESGAVRLVFSEPVASGAAALVTVDGVSQAWSKSGDGYTLTSSSTFTSGSHSLQFAAGAFDLADQQLVDLSSIGFSTATRPGLLAMTENASISRVSQVGNPYGFHGLRHDDETGLIYARHRYLDPELGRFTTTDPLGYVDGPNLYQFALNNPVNYSDPMGLAVYLFDGTWNCMGLAGDQETNVQRFIELARAGGHEVEYISGIGCTESGKSIYDGALGKGTAGKLDEMYRRFLANWNGGDEEVIIVGFSRGAALSRAFASHLHHWGVEDPENSRVIASSRGSLRLPARKSVPVDFLGLFDTVISFSDLRTPVTYSRDGRTIQEYDPLKIYENVAIAKHAVSLDEGRIGFPLESIHSAPGQANTHARMEVGFPGVHSDIGGGYGRTGALSSVALAWMWEEMRGAGIRLGPLNPAHRNLPPQVERMIHDSRQNMPWEYYLQAGYEQLKGKRWNRVINYH